MLKMLVAYDVDGNVVATLEHMVAKNDDGKVVGLVDFEAYEKSGESLTDIWVVSHAVGSGTWPEWLGGGVYNYKVELNGKKITALVHKNNGTRRDRAEIEAAIEQRVLQSGGKPADLRDLLGGPMRPLMLDDQGKPMEKPKRKRKPLPVLPNPSRRK